MPRKSPRGKPYHRPTNPDRPPRDDRSTPAGEHRPVLLAEVLAVLNPQPGDAVADCTLGFAGHAVELLKAVGPAGKLVATDLDPANFPAATEKLSAVGHPFALHHANFAGLPRILAEEQVTGLNGLVADLGMSSMQVDDPARGFSFMRDGPLDMRMDPTRGPTAAELLNALPEADLEAAFRELGDEPASAAIAAAVVARRATQPFARTGELKKVVEEAAPVRIDRTPGAPPERKQLLLPATRVFQAVRILVNRELANLRQLLRVLPDVLAPGGVAAVISFHSGEDRVVKATFRDGLRAGFYSEVSEESVRPTDEEKTANPRSRSAKLRWARRADG